MGSKYIIKIQKKYKNWIAILSVEQEKPIYKIFEQDLYPFYKANFTEIIIPKVTFTNDSTFLALPNEFKKILNLEAIDKDTNIVSLVNTVFEFYISNNNSR